MTAKHTASPWVARREDAHEWHIDVREPRYALLGDLHPWQAAVVCYGIEDYGQVGADVAEANARLIAAAPDLLAALRALASGDLRPETYAVARAAIAKAEGGE